MKKAKTRLEILEQEIEDLTEQIRHQFIERDLCIYFEQMETMKEVVEEIKVLQRRLEAIKQLTDLEREKSNGNGFHDFLACIYINPPQG